MKSALLKEFVEAFLEEQGAVIQRRDDQFLEAELPKGSPVKWPTRHLVLSFTQRAYKKSPESEFLTVGHPLLERILDVCRSRGRFSTRFVPPPGRKGRQPPLRWLPELDEDWTWGAPQEVYAPIILMLFVIHSSTMEAPDEIESFLVDPWTGELLSDGAGEMRDWESGAREPKEGRTVLPVPQMEAVLRLGLTLLDHRLRKRVQKVKHRHEEDLKDEVANIENYYRQLIEEVRRGNRRNHLSPQEREEKIRLLQLDWKRRIQEATEYLRPRTSIRLSALGVIQRPRWGLPAQPRIKKTRTRTGGATGSWLVAEHGQTRWTSPMCVACLRPAEGRLAPVKTGFLCEACRGATKVAAQEAQRAAS